MVRNRTTLIVIQILFFALAMTSNPWTIATVIEADMEAAYAGYSIDAQQTACFSSFGGNGNSA